MVSSLSLCSRESVTWRYLPTGEVRHAIYLQDASDFYPPALCGVQPRERSRWRVKQQLPGWYGTGTQDEYERVETLPECKRCAVLLKPIVGGQLNEPKGDA